ncbi:MAG: tandem-95 repeat protein, partial [Hormoscilla sp. GM102CHS1]|nr:tandem-95 repeat protein [Hormoscilla sp. GM102CHS1]
MENHELFMHADHLLLVDETQRIILGITGDDMGSQIREGGSGGMESQPVLVLTAVSTDEIEEIPPDVDPLTSIPRDGGHEQDLTLDIDRNGRVDALTDGLMLVRYMFGYSGADVVRDAVARDGIQIDAAEITSYLDELGLVLDVDGNGELTAQTDGIMIIRALFGFSGDIVVRNVLSPGAPRDMAEVTAYLEDLLSGPEAVNDSATVELGTTGTIDVLANDTDDNNDVLEITRFSTTSSQGGAIARDRNNNSLHYTPASGFRGTDSFKYSISKGNGGTSSATVTITVPNKAPEAGSDSAIVLLGTTGIIQVLANDTDDNGDLLSVTGFSATSSSGGENARDGNSLLYTPADGFRGLDSFVYSISDGN